MIGKFHYILMLYIYGSDINSEIKTLLLYKWQMLEQRLQFIEALTAQLTWQTKVPMWLSFKDVIVGLQNLSAIIYTPVKEMCRNVM